MVFIIVVCVSVDVESVMNSIVSLLLILETEKQEALIESLCEKLVKFREGERPTLRMQLYVHSVCLFAPLFFSPLIFYLLIFYSITHSFIRLFGPFAHPLVHLFFSSLFLHPSFHSPSYRPALAHPLFHPYTRASSHILFNLLSLLTHTLILFLFCSPVHSRMRSFVFLHVHTFASHSVSLTHQFSYSPCPSFSCSSDQSFTPPTCFCSFILLLSHSFIHFIHKY